jgi:hypothetical protein
VLPALESPKEAHCSTRVVRSSLSFELDFHFVGHHTPRRHAAHILYTHVAPHPPTHPTSFPLLELRRKYMQKNVMNVTINQQPSDFHWSSLIVVKMRPSLLSHCSAALISSALACSRSASTISWVYMPVSGAP